MRSPTFPPRRPSSAFRYILTSCMVFICLYYLNRLGTQDVAKRHPIDDLVAVAQKDFDDMLSRESHSLSDAAAVYRKARGRHPPPGFKEWYEFASERNAVVVEDFWDQIYHDLEPFWALPAGQIRKGAWDHEMIISVRNNRATASSDWFWTEIWLSLIRSIEHLLPDMDIPLNAMDEPRIVVPWEKMDEYMTTAAATRRLVSPKEAVTMYQNLSKPGEGPDRTQKIEEKDWEKKRPYWRIARRGCAPQSLARTSDVLLSFNHTPVLSQGLAGPHMHRGFVSNSSLSTDICHQPDLQGLHGIFVEPLTVSSTQVLFPLFGGSKLSTNSEILLPAPMYWSEEERFMAGGETGVPWSWKKEQVMWRGVATGGKNLESNWKAFQRHRFVSMNNGTKLRRAEEWTELPLNFAMPSSSYGLTAQENGRLGAWVDGWSDVSFVDLMCFPKMEKGQCNYTGPYFSVSDTVKMAKQFDYKYLPDIDGNSFSGRYLSFLRSSSLPVKATLWREWHDSRLVAWKHFVPMDNRYGDWYGIMEYFLGYGDDVQGHDAVAEDIASSGKEWAERVLRREDMQIYVLRLLLEYARISDERRESMGWVEDLQSPGRGRTA
ncbi:hypothetical protein GQ53DRAFT_799235 [Thozetella sp. PMI_491]|nr:hypothetical protein GQ53DRAFT_799235 [Thozetella sp. PMI_491]